ncbi:MAG: gamma-glutamyl-gamma-aminobutyrate hydrolase family protein [Candidatus Rifleibacteriota bacterium]
MFLANSRKFFFVLLIAWASVLSASDKPIIGLTASFSKGKIQLNFDYVDAIKANGGIPIILPPTNDPEVIRNYIKMIDGAVFTGGRDIPPEAYGQKLHATSSPMAKERYEFEKLFIPMFLRTGKPALGICLGMQFANVAMGGTMYQDIPSMIGTDVCHRNGEMYTNFHSVGIAKGSRLEKILGSSSEKVISRHHQAVDKVANCFRVVARSSDGVIEALERKDGKFGVFVQWHPESMAKADREHRDRIFRSLIEAAKK